jgi:hypothetical protein
MVKSGYWGQFSANERKQVKEMSEEGSTDREIAKALGRSMTAIVKVRRRMNILKDTWQPKTDHEPTQEGLATSITDKVRNSFIEQGYFVKTQVSLMNGLARPDLIALKDQDQILIEVKEVREANNHTLITGAGQLLFYRYLNPQAKVMLAIPNGSCKVSNELRAFLNSFNIEVREF